MKKRSLIVLTWNLGRPHLGRIGQRLGWDSRAADVDLPRVALGIARAGADVVALQELASERQLAHLIALLGSEWSGALDDGGCGGPRCDRHVAVLAHVRAAPRSFSRDQLAGGRSVASVIGPDYVVAAAHLEPFDALARAHQAQELRRVADGFSEENIVLAGDMNIDPTHARLRGGPDALAWSRLVEKMHDGGRHAGATTIVRRRIDHVLVRGPAAVATEADVLRSMRLPLGDHMPLRVSVSLGEPAPASGGTAR